MANAGIQDNSGHYLGKTKNNRLVILDMWQRNKDRVNSNWFVSGLPGSGKSTFLKKVFTYEYAFGTKIIVLDPEREYVDLARHSYISGDVINCAGGNEGRINPLQIRPTPRITKEDLDEGEVLSDFYEFGDLEEGGTSDMALYIQQLRVFFKLYFGAENFDFAVKSILEKCLIELYNDFKIDWNTDIRKLQPSDFPTMENLYEKVLHNGSDSDLSEYEKNAYNKLRDLLYSVGKGADRYIWNGPTTLKPKSNFIDLDTSALLEADENVKRAQFYNLTSWGWQQMSINREEKVLLGVDEGYLFVDPELADLMKFMRNISKRARKYEGGLLFITHSVSDVLDPAVKRLGQAIIDNACYKFIMGTDGKNLAETKELFHLSDREEALLSAKNRGQGLLYAGSTRLNLRVDVSEKLLEMFGSAGGR